MHTGARHRHRRRVCAFVRGIHSSYFIRSCGFHRRIIQKKFISFIHAYDRCLHCYAISNTRYRPPPPPNFHTIGNPLAMASDETGGG